MQRVARVRQQRLILVYLVEFSESRARCNADKQLLVGLLSPQILIFKIGRIPLPFPLEVGKATVQLLCQFFWPTQYESFTVTVQLQKWVNKKIGKHFGHFVQAKPLESS